MNLKPRRCIELASKFRVHYSTIGREGMVVLEREFRSLRSLRQWVDRNESLFGFVALKTEALMLGEWEPFTTIGKKTITLSDLETIVRDMREDYKPSKPGN